MFSCIYKLRKHLYFITDIIILENHILICLLFVHHCKLPRCEALVLGIFTAITAGFAELEQRTSQT